jgi:hypothetical protein
VHDDRLLEIYNYIRLNEIDHLRELILNASITGLAHLRFNFFEDDEEVMVLADDRRITMSYLNPILLAVKCKSFDCLTYLVNTFGVRQAMCSTNLTVRLNKKFDFTYRNLMFPLIMRGKDNDILAFLLKHEGFIFSSFDFNSFIA